MPHSLQKPLLGISLPYEAIQGFIKWRTYEGFLEYRLLQLAIERESEIIGEAMARLELLAQAALGQKTPEYRKIIGFRNLLAHGYDVIDNAALWGFAQNRVPELLEKARGY